MKEQHSSRASTRDVGRLLWRWCMVTYMVPLACMDAVTHAAGAPAGFCSRAKPCSALMRMRTWMLGLKVQPSVVPRNMSVDRLYVSRRP